MLSEIKNSDLNDLEEDENQEKAHDPIDENDNWNSNKNVYSDDEFVYDAYGQEAENTRDDLLPMPI